MALLTGDLSHPSPSPIRPPGVPSSPGMAYRRKLSAAANYDGTSVGNLDLINGLYPFHVHLCHAEWMFPQMLGRSRCPSPSSSSCPPRGDTSLAKTDPLVTFLATRPHALLSMRKEFHNPDKRFMRTADATESPVNGTQRKEEISPLYAKPDKEAPRPHQERLVTWPSVISPLM